MVRGKTTIYQYLTSRKLYILAGVWFSLTLIPITRNMEPLPPTPLIYAMQDLHFYVPLGLLGLLIVYTFARETTKEVIRKFYSKKFWTIILSGLLALYLSLWIIEDVLDHSLPMWGTFLSLGNLTILILLIVHKLRNLDNVKVITVAVIAGFFVLGFWEVMFVMTNYYITYGQEADLIRILKGPVFKLSIMFLPFIGTYIWYYKKNLIRAHWATILFGVMFITMWLIWIFPGDYWIIWYWEEGQVIKPPIDWPMYQLSRFSKIILGLAVYSSIAGKAR